MSSPARGENIGCFARDVRNGLSKSRQKELPSLYLYDEIGSALFEAITLLPEYGLTRAEDRLIRKHSNGLLERLPSPLLLTELGSGSGRKTRWLLDALSRRQPVVYHPIDISSSALSRCRHELSELGAVSIVGLESSYLEGLKEAASRRTPDQTMLVLFLGSTIGNFDRKASHQFLLEIHHSLKSGDALLLGTDLEKPVPEMLLAYDDPAGVTAAFNLNLLARINRELGGNFVLGNFKHAVRYNHPEQRIEMHLRSERNQSVRILSADFSVTLEEGETIFTEACRKFRSEELTMMARDAGFVCDAQWIDTEWSFAESLWIRS